ncbi:MAG: DUF2182 domain-containing protein [Roseibium sp.]|uniref:DUF2182 domain-containing protein n=1 Tax=Roseibium sp. TaxID=1936156 RepID=UPI003D9C1D22
MMPIDLGIARMLRNAPVVGSGVIAVTLACWVFFFAGAGTGMDVWRMSVPGLPPISGQTEMMASTASIGMTSMTFMWWTMMLAMMMPGALSHLPSHGTEHLPATENTIGFWSCYACVWLGFSIAAAAIQYQLVDAGLLHGMNMWSTNTWFSAALLAIAGLYQFTGVKARSLTTCRKIPSGNSPFRSGLTYGLNCLASSLPLMLLLFAGGVMNVFWVALLTVVVTLEKALPNPKPFSIAVGAASLGTSAVVLITRH